MTVILLRVLRSCALSVVIATSAMAAVRADVPAANAGFDNPFCAAVGRLFPWDRVRNVPADGATSTYALLLWTKARSNLSGRLTLVDAFNAWSVDVPKLSIPKSASDRGATLPFLVEFEHQTTLKMNFVDAVGIDNAPLADCPSYVQGVNSAADWPPGTTLDASTPTLRARFVQSLSGNCAQPYVPLKMTKGTEPLVGLYGDRPRDTDIQVFVDSTGRVVDTRVWKSSGVEGLDASAIGAAESSTFTPAEFLCTPVVSDGIFTWTYKP